MKNIIDSYKNNIKTIIQNITGKQNEDLEQEIYLKTWKNLDKYKEQGKFKQWISTVAANICRDYLKSSYFKHSVNSVSTEEMYDLKENKISLEDYIEQKQRRKRVAKAILSLKPKLQEVIVMYEIDGFSYDEIAEKIKCPAGTVKSRIFKARQELSILLKDLL